MDIEKKSNDDNIELYMNYLNRNTKKSGVSNIATYTNPDSSKTDEISSKITEAEMKLFETFPNLSFIADVIEESIILVGEDGKETADSLSRRQNLLSRLESTLESDALLFDKVRSLYPSFGLDMDKKIDIEDYRKYVDMKESLRRVCSKVNSTPVSDQKIINNGEIPITEYGEILSNIGECIDSVKFNKACEIEKTFIKKEIQVFKNMSREKTDDDLAYGMSRLEADNESELKKVDVYNDLYNGKVKKQNKNYDEYYRY